MYTMLCIDSDTEGREVFMKKPSPSLFTVSTISTTLFPLRLRLLKLLLAFGTLAILLTWCFEAWSERISPVDRVAYPLMVALFIAYFITIKLRPVILKKIELLSFATFAGYAIVNLQFIIYHADTHDIYTVATFAQWFPLVFTSAFIFLETRHAIIISICIYLSLLVPSLLHLVVDSTNFGINETYAVLLNMYISHPVYIIVLSGFAQLKEHFVRVKAHADVMSIAASIDHLTGTANRRAIAQALQYALGQAQVADSELAIILLDIDDFKRINDTYGHDVGDQVLIDIAGFLRQQLRAADTLGRWGGEEFMVVVTDTNLAATVQLAERLRTLIADRSQPPVGQVTVSFGVAMAIAGDTPDTLVKRADEALYRAKQQGCNRVEVADLISMS
jgi:diguanylate cyclase (GGDEF)-like protein